MSTSLVLIIGVIVAFAVLKRLGLVSAQTARAYLKNGALVVDVRSSGEFNSGHLPGAVNIPLDQLENGVARRAPDKNQVLLLHCLSGTRSGIARRTLKALGYASVFNLGSYGRARRILAGKK